MISATAWIARGKTQRHPNRYTLDDGELERVSNMANVQFEDAKKQLERAQKELAGDWHDDDEEETPASEAPAKEEDPDDLSKYNLDEYDDDAPTGVAMGAFSNIKGLQFHASNDEDPYMTVKDAQDDEENDREELEVYPTDNLVLIAKTEDDVSQLEAYVYSASDANLYVHHDLMLPSFPLCLEWLDYTPAGQNPAAGATGNYVAVGTMDPEIEIWSMDVVEGLYPDAILGRKEATQDMGLPVGTGKKKKKLLKPRTKNAEYHVDAVLSLSWNPLARNLLASASADCTVKLWDLSRPSTQGEASAFRSFDAHTDKVQSVAWQAAAPGAAACQNPAVLLTASYDKTVRIFDTRAPDTAVVAQIAADVEAIRWNGWKENQFLVSLENGMVHAFDARQLSAAPSQNAVFTLSAHDTACTTLDVSPHIPGAILTGSSDKTLKLWNVEDASINLVTSRDLGVGKVFSATFSPNDPMTIAAAGSQGKLQIWNALSNLGVRKTFDDRLRKLDGINIDGDEPARGDGVVGLLDDDEQSDDDEPAMQE